MKYSLVTALFLGLNLTTTAQALDRRALGCIAHVVYGEMRGEPFKDQLKGGWSVELRRQANQAYFGGSDICDVAYKIRPRLQDDPHYEYDGVKARIKDLAAWKRSLYVARLVLLGIGRPKDPIMYFCNTYVRRGACSWHDRNLIRVSSDNSGGQHKFYIDPKLSAPATLVSYGR